MHQSGREAVRVIGAFGDAPGRDEVSASLFHVDIAPPVLPPINDCLRRPASGPGFSMGLMDKLDIWLHPDDTGFARDELKNGSSKKDAAAKVAAKYGIQKRHVYELALMLK